MANAQPQHYNIRWNNYHSNLVAVFDEFLINASFADVTLFLDDGRCLKCHKVVLAACSNYFQDIFFKEPHKHIVVALKDVKYGEIKSILEFMYRGEIHVAHDQLSNLLRVAKSFQVKGLHDINDFQNLLIPRDYATNAETSVSPPYSSPPLSQQPISNITSSIPHNNRPSPPHSTELDATSQGLMKRLDRYIHSGGIFESRTSKFLPGLQKPEWKRYKQYTREDISNAIESVKSGTSALQAARIWGVPSRTLYDKVKKLGITNNRSSKRNAGRSSSSAEYSCNYGENSNYPTNSSYVSECDDETDNSHNHHENNTSMIQQPETSSYSSHITVKNESNKLNRDNSNDQNNLHEDSLMIKEENDEQYSNYDDEIQDLSMHSKNNKTIATSNINNKDSDNMNHS
ncbi:PREDICTED: sex determination protein fruitless-like [Polistes dominula]|uniref:Sex determination protein fruitless-like n=1 Tax=Polistes dominula TaxID=743375 RepID=A0ABM1JEU4_POLDO|nr:PREDICTED: sex determination protein fruitless-like [Polistes dominula]